MPDGDPLKEFKEPLVREVQESLLREIKELKDAVAQVSRQLSTFQKLDPAEVDLEKEIGAAAATAARDEKYEDARNWLSLRKDYLDQNASRQRRLFRLVLTGILFAVAVTLLVMWLYGEFTPAAAPAVDPAR